MPKPKIEIMAETLAQFISQCPIPVPFQHVKDFVKATTHDYVRARTPAEMDYEEALVDYVMERVEIYLVARSQPRKNTQSPACRTDNSSGAG
jgi:hypothetical protein